MLGFYDNFPENIHKITSFAISISNKKLQQTLVRMLAELNKETLKLECITNPSTPQCLVVFEVGIAQGNDFNYLDSEEASRVLKTISKKPFQIMDFICVMRYYKLQNEKKSPLRFDYYMLRLAFNKKVMEIRAFHERGPRHTSPEDIINFIVGKINEIVSKKVLREMPELS